MLKGDICHTPVLGRLDVAKNGCLVCLGGKSAGIYTELPEIYRTLPQMDFTGKLIVPGLVDLHTHASQYAFRGIGMDRELLDWLENCAFREEAKYAGRAYAGEAYGIFMDDLKRSATTRAVIYATLHTNSTITLMNLAEKSGLKTFVGKVNMDRNSPPQLSEGSPEAALSETVRWLDESRKRAYCNTQPILTPRFIPSCSDRLLDGLGRLQVERGLPVQSHLSENHGEIQWVAELCPQAEFYGDAYQRFGLFGGGVPTVMAHCVHSSEKEIARMRERQVYVAHCPQSNANLSSGIAPIRRYLDERLRIGLGSDVAGGASLSIFRAMTDAIQESKLRWRLVDQSLIPLTMEEAFYLATKGGGSFFGKVGSFEEGYELDALVLDDSSLRHPQPLSVRERLERFLYLSPDHHISHKFVAGDQIF